MKLGEMYRLAVEMGIENDPRGSEQVRKLLAKAKERYEGLKDEEKDEFDVEEIKNPYSDTRISYGAPELEVKRVLVGIDVEVSELLLAREMERIGKRIDLILSHHPVGMGRIHFSDVMNMQADIMMQAGIPINVAEGILAGRIGEVERSMMPSNHYRIVDAARLLDIPLMCIHTPADNQVNAFLRSKIEEAAPETLEDVVKAIKNIPEYKAAAGKGIGPRILVGSEKKRAGKIVVAMTGGTGGPKEEIEELVKARVGTIVEMHLSEERKKEAEKHHLNVVIAGHMASDSVGMNLILDEFEKRGVEIIPFSGLIRHGRI